ncbi:MAG: cytochrome P450 [Deltaproteobacteria bacterium]|nr:cytochrome P450 [Deltaproteobacteria bacterium]
MREAPAASVDPTLSFDPHDRRFVEDGVPFDVLARIRREQPVYRTPSGAWYLSRHADVEAALVDVDTFRAELGPITGIPAGCATIPEEQHFLSEIPEPRHGRIRRLFNAIFAWHRVRQLEPILEAECNRLVDGLFAACAAGRAPDLHGEYALSIPAFAMAHIMGLGREAVGLFMQWSMDGTMMTRPATPGVAPEGPASHVYFRARIAEQRALPEPTNHVFKVLLGAEIDGRPLSDQELTTQLHFMVQAGVHTTRSFLAHLVNRLVQDPALFARLDADREQIPLYLEESLRHDAPVQRTTRIATRDVEIGGVLIKQGETVEMGIGSANRDEAQHEAPAEFRLDRSDPRGHLAFGAGSHVCPGAMLARLEGATAVRVLLDRAKALERVPGVIYPPLPGSLGHQPVPARLVGR